MMNKLISVIITTYNRSDRLSYALESVLTQSYLNIEVLIVNDGDEGKFNLWWDNFRSVNSTLLSRPISIYHSNQQGANYARKLGFERAAGVYISYLDDDDIWLPDKLTNQVCFFKKDKKCIMATSNFFQIDSKNNRKKKIRLSKKIEFDNLLFRNIIGGFSFPLILKSVLQSDFFITELQSSQDWSMWIFILKNNKDGKVLNTGYYDILYMIDDSNNIKITNSPQKKILGIQQFLDIHMQSYPVHLYKWHRFVLDLRKRQIPIKQSLLFKFMFLHPRVLLRYCLYLYARYF